MDQTYSIPGAIVIAGALVAGSVLVTRSPARLGPPSPSAATAPAVAGAAQPQKIDLRPVDTARDHIRGDANAPITLVEYSDLECPFCKLFHPTLQQALQEYDGKVRWVYRHSPLAQLHPKAAKEAEASECAGDKFWEFIDKVFAVTPSNNGLDPAELPKIAKSLGLDVPAFEKCLKDGTYAQRVQDDLADAERAGLQGTPHTVIIGPKGETIPFSGAQPYGNLKQVIDGLL